MQLEGLERVDWSHLHHSHGTAEQFPRWLIDLASEDQSEWELGSENEQNALNNLVNFSLHQGFIYEITSYVIPFINQLLITVSEEHKETLVFWLNLIARGEQYPTEDNDLMRQRYIKQGRDFDEVVVIAKQYFTAAQTRLRESLPQYFTLIEGNPSKKRSAAAELIGSIGHQSLESRQIVLNWLSQEADETLRAEIINSLNKKNRWFDEDDDTDD